MQILQTIDNKQQDRLRPYHYKLKTVYVMKRKLKITSHKEIMGRPTVRQQLEIRSVMEN